MDENSTSALQYGHLGKPVYSSETQTWAFSRTLVPSSYVSYAGVTKTTIPSPLTALRTSSIENKGFLPRVYPELAACWPLSSNETLSHAITTCETCDPLVSSLFDIGYAVDLENNDSGSRVVSIAVVASGECGNTISFRKIQDDVVELRGKTITSIRVPAIGQPESIEWSAGGAPVRQICFARTVEEKATWMAARLPHSTTIFRPQYHRNSVPVLGSCDGDHVLPNRSRKSRLDANPLVEISNMRTGGFAHADVTFNPWYQKQFAIVDERGNWSVWELSGRHRRTKGNWTAVSVKSGTLPWLDLGDGHDSNDHPRHDGWAAIEWAGDVNSFIVSDRRCPMLYRMDSGQVYPYMIELGLKRRSEWILDIKRSASNVSHVFILTTTRIFWLDITSSPDPTIATGCDSRPPLYPRLSWRHFRDPEDTTLRLACLLVDKDFYLILYSRLNRLALAFQCPSSSSSSSLEQTDAISIPDPFIMEIPSISRDSMGSQHSNNIQLSTLVFREITHLPLSVGKQYYDPHAKLIKLFMVDSGLTVRESIYVGPSRDGHADESTSRDVLRVKKRHQGVQRAQTAFSQDDFVVDDLEEYVLGTGVLTPQDTGMSSITPLAIPEWTLNYAQAYAVATGRLTLLPREEDHRRQTPEISFQEGIQELEAIATGSTTSDHQTTRTGLEALGSSPLLDDIDQSSYSLQSFLSKEHPALLLEKQVGRQRSDLFSPLFFPSTDFTEDISALNLLAIYDQLVNDWLAGLPYDIPGRTRIIKEKIIRGVAADLILAQIRLKVQPAYAVDELDTSGRKSSGDAPSSLSTSMDDPFDALSSGNAMHASQRSVLPGNGNLDDLSSSVPPGSTLARGETEVESPSDIQSTYTSLSAFTTFSRERAMPRNVAIVLDHWQPGTDPAGYNWQRTVRIQETEESQPASKGATPKRRSRKKTPSSQGTSLNASAPPPMSSVPSDARRWGSQPENSEAPVLRLPSSQAVEEDVPMTQIERGTFGGREAGRKSVVKARKKKRAAGF
ncbi:hypothetical protein BO78DRAFT_346920 [Aspergillus sclerotiicarbonarius CBS 121057]|uniref:RNA polymerase I-specific transcription initiation factor RRN6-like protein n=1 Tax=Aspergillus sclerotiicarbonarius (strain CBS 121057 / IBT 28362) TaxID=1448318 RepID=A0A319E9S0_ASPSB|nr:hypothetical protein BO78DRAFT_346920 [Aspergillus sclerotiicarbonarius CBS 121057]